MTLRPSETSRGRRWLANFSLDERQAARLLIDSLRVISSARFRITLSEALDAAIGELRGPVGVYPVRELPSDPSTAERSQADDRASSLLPLDHPFTAVPGSEGVVGNIIRDVVGRRPQFRRAASYNSLDRLRQHRVRSLLLVDDYSGTGNQIVSYVNAWMRHPTVRSWHSYGLLRIHILLLAASAQAQQRLEDSRFVASVRYLERGLGFDTAPWTEREREAVKALCRRYAHKPDFALGYRETCGLLTLHHTVPNNLPNILWQTKCPRVRNWSSLFSNRVMSPQLQTELDDYRLETDPKRICTIIRQERLGDALDAQANTTVRILLLVLGAIESGHRDPMALGSLLGLSLEAAQRTLEACQELRLLDAAGRLTNEGRAELRRARNRPTSPAEAPASGEEGPYYPVTLRGAV
ncbi:MULTISPECIES: phosphoribosyltransferase-like protein [Micromonospora]|uniref:Uncharacterized protein n=1 Tax=Micromonospora saelicesensis TaxID=285676 RepID=A0A1C4ZZB8_9ACTN|nr:hypothetical protein [Micromonospora saelicesensis]SCF38293.1 hypothetical protein GA0070561_6052 [Micromonospora saelicesensis]